MMVEEVGMMPQPGYERFSASHSQSFPKAKTENKHKIMFHIKIILVPDLSHIVFNITVSHKFDV